MLANTRNKWIVSTMLAAVLLVLAMVGGKWGTTYAADASTYEPPIIDSIDPSNVPAGSPNKVMTIYGSNFGNYFSTGVYLHEPIQGGDWLIYPIESVSLHQITALIHSQLLFQPTVYELRVLKSIINYPPTIPTIPNPPEEQISNLVYFTVFEGEYMYLPLIIR